MEEKKCFKCGEIKPLMEFYKHSRMADGHLNKCKECNKKDTKKNYVKRRDYYLAYDKKRNSDISRLIARRRYLQEHPEIKKKSIENYNERYPQKYAAHIIAGNAINRNKIKRSPCEKCGRIDVEAHHDDYSKPLDVRWLCRKHHYEEHGKVCRTIG